MKTRTLLPTLWKLKAYKRILQTIICQLDNLDKIFLGTCKLPKMTQEEIENLNRPITSKEIGPIIKNLQTKNQDQKVSLVNYIEHLK